MNVLNKHREGHRTGPVARPWKKRSAIANDCLLDCLLPPLKVISRTTDDADTGIAEESLGWLLKPSAEPVLDAPDSAAWNKHANYYVQNGDGINQLQYNPSGQTVVTA